MARFEKGGATKEPQDRKFSTEQRKQPLTYSPITDYGLNGIQFRCLNFDDGLQQSPANKNKGKVICGLTIASLDIEKNRKITIRQAKINNTFDLGFTDAKECACFRNAASIAR